MKTAIYIEGSDLQIILTPENEVEKALLAIDGGERSVLVAHGEFYRNMLGYFRQGGSDESLMLCLKRENAGEPTTEAVAMDASEQIQRGLSG